MTLLNGFSIAGISVQTTNNNNQSAKDLGKLWERFYAEGITQKVPNKQSLDIYVLYTNYESDFSGSYTAIIGHRVTNLEAFPQDITGFTLPDAEYKKITVTGDMPQAIIDTWKYIWEHDKELKRKYTCDFELYPATDNEKKDIEIYIAI